VRNRVVGDFIGIRMNIFIDTVDHKAPQAATAEDIDTCADQ
jgi:hypothetical protein